MKITKEKLKQIIKEELKEAIYAKHRGAGFESGTDWVDSETGRVVGYSGPGEDKMHLGLPGDPGAGAEHGVSPKFDKKGFSDEVSLAIDALGGDKVLEIVKGAIDTLEV